LGAALEAVGEGLDLGVRSAGLLPKTTCSEISVKPTGLAGGPASKDTMYGKRANCFRSGVVALPKSSSAITSSPARPARRTARRSNT
jgi:hypothetical protein